MSAETPDPNSQNAFYYFAYVEKSTGLATVPPQNPSDPAIQSYGPYVSNPATAVVYDMSLILHGNRHFEGNFRPLARCLLAVIQHDTANGPPADPLLLIAYGGCLIDALALSIKLNRNINEMPGYWDIMEGAFLTAVQSLQNEFDEHRQRHLELLFSLRNHVFEAYAGNTWPNDVWPKFRSWISGEDTVPSDLPPTCFQVLIGAKAIEEQEDVALPDKPAVEFRTPYAVHLCDIMEAQLGKLRVPGFPTPQLLFIKMIVFILGRHFDSEADIKPSYRPSLFSRYAGHIVDALILCIPENGGFMIQKKTYPQVLYFSSDDYFDGLIGSRREAAMLCAFEEIVTAYNKRQWPAELWKNLLLEIDNSNPNFTSNPSLVSNLNLASNPCPAELVKMYEGSCGSEQLRRTDVSFPVPENEPWTSENEGFEDSADGEIKITEVEEVEMLDDCYKCSGPTSVTYTFRWLCKSDHTVAGLREETFGPFAVMNGDCATRIHDEVKKIFGFATESQSVRCDPEFRAPTFVVGSCLHYKDAQVVPMEYQNGHWYPGGQAIPMDMNGEEGDGGM